MSAHAPLIHAALDSLQSAIAVLDERGNIIHVNDAWKAFGAANGGEENACLPLGVNYFDICRHAMDGGDPFAEAAFYGMKVVIADELPFFLLEYPCDAPHKPRWFLLQITRLAGERRGLVVAHVDISERKRLELAVRESNEQLEARVAERTRELEASRTEALHLAAVKSEFLANMSHEIRTPLNAILGLSQIGARVSKGRGVMDTFTRIITAGQLLLAVVNDILDFSKIEAGKLVIENSEFRLADAIDRAIDINAERAYAKGLTLRVDEADNLPLRVRGDITRLTQVLVNLLSNAIKFTEYGHIRLTVAVQTNADGRTGIGFIVEDTGIGMSAAHVANLFRPFTQADSSTTRKFGGSGLGLTICARLVQAMNGTISVRSTPEEGSQFTAWLPLPALLPQPGDASPAPTSADALRTVTLCGLTADETTQLTRTLGRLGYQVAQRNNSSCSLRSTGYLVMDAKDIHTSADCRDCAERAGIDNDTRRLILINTPGQHLVLTGDLESVVMLTRPVRARQVAALCARYAHQAQQAPLSQAHFATATEEPDERLAGLRVLVVEDNEVNQLVIDDLLTEEGAQVTLADDGQKALDRLASEGIDAYDLVLTDIQMPVMDGHTFTRTVRAMGISASALPIIGLTAHALAEERERCLASGMQDHVTKPITTDLLVASILRHRRATTFATATDPIPLLTSPVKGEELGAIVVPDSALFDLPLLLERFQGRQIFVNKILATALASQSATPARLRAAVAGGHLATLVSLAHTLKGVGGSIKSQRVYEQAQKAEDAARSARDGQATTASADPSRAIERANTLANTLADTLDQLLHTLQHHLQEANHESASS